MVTSRTGTAIHKRMRKVTITRARRAGLTHCPSCGVELDYLVAQQPNSAEADEITPFAVTGRTSTDPGDWQVLCRLCNQRKGGRAGARAREDRRAADAQTRVIASPIW